MKALFGMLLLFGMLFSIANVTTEGGNVTNVYFNQTQNSTYWDGLYGDVVLGAGVTYTYTVTGNNIVLLNMVAQDPPCTYTGLSMHIIAVNNSMLALPLAAGNLAQLDGFIGSSQNGSSTFTGLDTFVLNSGTYNNVPTAYSYANGTPSPDFREGYLNDALGNLVFVADVVDNRPNWNGSTSDYQVMLPNNGSGVQYWIWVEVNYTCVNITPPSPHDKDHKLFIPPIPTQEMESGTPFGLPVTVENRGDYREDVVEVSITDCPGGFICEIVLIPKISKGEEEQVTLEIDGGPPGTYVLEVCAKNEHADYCREFILEVLPECDESDGCPGDEYCEDGQWVPKHGIGEECEDDCWCLSGICENGVCVLCETDGDCEDDEECSDGYCVEIECPCGVVENHACIPYECCSDEDCEATEFCISLECVPKELDIILIDGELIVGEEGLFQIMDNKGKDVPFADVFTNEGETVADGNGYASLPFSADGLVYADAEGYPQAAKLFAVMQVGVIEVPGDVVAGEGITITVLGRDGNPLVGVELTVEGNVLVTDSNGQVKYTFEEPGEKVVTAYKPGYLIDGAKVDVGEPTGIVVEGVCRFPILLNWLEVPAPELYWLWVLSLILGTINFIVLRKRISRDFLGMLAKRKFSGNYKEELKKRRRDIYFKSLGYSYLPLLLALPNSYIFNICFMSNIVLLQAIGEAAIIVKKMLGKKSKKEELKESKIEKFEEEI